MNAYVIEWRIDEEYKTLHGISGIFLSREDAVSALEGTRMPCYKRIPNGIWKLGTSGCVAIIGEARPMTKDGVTWEIYGPDGGLVDGNGMDEPEYTIQEFEVGRIEGMGL